MKGWEKLFHAKGNQKRAGVAMLTSDKIDIKSKTITRDKKSLYNDKVVNSSKAYNN